jgi:AcrR family transcriptional regulator
MPRPRTATDADILQGAIRAISRVGPGRLTLAEVGREVGLSPATLLQRFGSKRGLLLALAQHAAGSIDACFAQVRRATGSPLDALMAAATEMVRHVESPEALANHLAFLQIDLSDPEFHALALAGGRRTLAGYEELLREAMAAGELAPCDVAQLARAIQAITGGSLINWAIHRDGTVLEWVRGDLDVLLAPYRQHSVHVDAFERPAPRARHRSRA